jgi:hypothetical protein
MPVEIRDGVVRLAPDDWTDLVERDSVPDGLDGIAGLAEAIAATRDPAVQLQLDVASADRVARHHAWASPEAAVVLLQVDSDQHQLMPMPPAFVAGALARLTKLGPRKAPVEVPHPRDVDGDLLEDLFHLDDMRRMSAFQAMAVRFAWVLATSRAETDVRVAVVEDAAGRWMVEEAEKGWQVVPTTATEIWRSLTSLLIAVTMPAADEDA